MLQKYQEQVDGLNAKVLALQQQQRNVSSTTTSAASSRVDPMAEAWTRVSLSERDFSDVVRVTFETIAEGRPTLDVEEAMNAVRVLVTSGFGLDEVMAQNKMLSGNNQRGLTSADFQVLCSDVVKKWRVYQK
jgi:hypothetical protein